MFVRILLLSLIAVSALTFNSCKTTSNTTVTTDVAGPTVIQRPVIADLDVAAKRVEGSATGKGIPLDEVKQMAITDALTKSKADVLVEPRFTINSKFNQKSVTVSGYPAKYVNFQPMEAADTIFVDKHQLNTVTKQRVTKQRNGKAKRIAAITGSSIGGAVLLFFLTIFFL